MTTTRTTSDLLKTARRCCAPMALCGAAFALAFSAASRARASDATGYETPTSEATNAGFFAFTRPASIIPALAAKLSVPGEAATENMLADGDDTAPDQTEGKTEPSRHAPRWFRFHVHLPAFRDVLGWTRSAGRPHFDFDVAAQDHSVSRHAFLAPAFAPVPDAAAARLVRDWHSLLGLSAARLHDIDSLIHFAQPWKIRGSEHTLGYTQGREISWLNHSMQLTQDWRFGARGGLLQGGRVRLAFSF